MKTFSSALAAHLAGGATTLCTCWRIARRDGTVLGFTDHDRTIVFGGVSHEPASGLDASEAVAHAGLQVGGLEVAGAFASERLTEADLRAGLFDNAQVESWLVNWGAPAERHLMRVGSVGEVRRDAAAFTAEVRGLAHELDQERGRLFRATCDAELGDARCRVDISGAEWSASAIVLAADGPRRVRAALPGDRPTGFFDGGLLVLTGGAHDGRRSEVIRHLRDAGGDRLELWHDWPGAIAPGAAFTVSAGCDKRFETCRDRFANAANFRGFPHMPGNDFVLAYPSRDREKDGEALFE